MIARNLDALWLPLAGIFGLQVVSSIFAYLGRWWGAQAGEEAWAVARNRVHAAFHQVDPERWMSHRVGDLVSRIVSDTATLKTFVQSVVPTTITTFATLLATAVVLALVEPMLLAVVAAPLPFAVGILYVLRGRILRSSSALMERQADLQAAVTESVSGRAAVRAYGASSLVERRVEQAGEGLREASLSLERDQAALYPVSNLILSIVLLAALAAGAYYAVDGMISVGGLVVSYFYLARALGPVRSLNQVAFGWQRTTAALARVDSILEMVVDRQDGAPADALELRDAGFSWATTPTLRNVDLKTGTGVRIAVIAPSGAGKSTAAQLMLGLIEPSEGTATLGGQKLTSLRSAAAAGIGYVEQDPFLVRGTLRDNVAFSRELDDTALERALRIAGVDFANERGGLELAIEERGGNLSGGQRKRVALARALAGQPGVIVIDQLATDLEEELVDQIFERLVASGISVIYLGHAVPAALEPHEVYQIVDSEFVLREEVADVLASG